MNSSPRWVANLRWLLLSLACLATLLALFVVEENWRGDRAWAAFQREDQLRHPRRPALTVPNERNLFKTPSLARAIFPDQRAPGERALASTGFDLLDALRVDLTGNVSFDDIRRQLKIAAPHIKADSTEPARDVLAALQPIQPTLDEISQAARERPEAGFGPFRNPWEHSELTVEPVFRVLRALTLRARTELALGHHDRAYADAYAISRICSGFCTEPGTLLNFIVGMGGYAHLMGIVTDGIARRAWSERQLAELQPALFQLVALAAREDYILCERDLAISFLDSPALPSKENSARPFWLFRGWIQQNKLTLARHYEDDVLPFIEANSSRPFPERLARYKQQVEELKSSRSPYKWLSRLCVSNLEGVLESIVQLAMRSQAVATLCALERHRVAQGGYPDSLQALVPTYLPEVPRDIFDGQSLRLETLPDGSRRLFSAGLDAANKGDDIVVPLPAMP